MEQLSYGLDRSIDYLIDQVIDWLICINNQNLTMFLNLFNISFVADTTLSSMLSIIFVNGNNINQIVNIVDSFKIIFSIVYIFILSISIY